MKTKLFKIVCLLGLLFLAQVLAGCHTWEGLGKDVEKTGEKMQDDAKK